MPLDNTFAHLDDNRSMPAATVIPVLHYPDVRMAADWLCRIFGFSERLRIGTHRIQLNVGCGAVVIAQGAAGLVTNGSHSVMVRVTNVDEHFAKVQRAGVKVDTPTSYPFGERQYSVADLAGHIWTFSQSESNVDPSVWGGELVSTQD